MADLQSTGRHVANTMSAGVEYGFHAVTTTKDGTVTEIAVTGTQPVIVYAACRECKPQGPLTVIARWDHSADSVGGLVLRVMDEHGVTHTVLGHDVSSTPVGAA
jgi:inorganic pyrophosphatase